MAAVNEAEEFVHDLCRKSFLSLWTVENPIGPKKGKELADALIVVGSDIVVVSVKERNIKPSGNIEVDADRWYRDAIEGSIKQLRGAGRALKRMTEARRTDNPEVVLALPEVEHRNLHYIAVALGGEELVATAPEQHDFGFVHVFDRPTFDILLRELDTISDFIAYLGAKEAFLADTHVMLDGGECDLLAIYLRKGRKFPQKPRVVILEQGLWEQLRDEPSFRRRKKADEVSYAWDNLIEKFAGHLRGGTLLGNAPQEHLQQGLWYMVRENRFHRRLLGEGFIGFIKKARAGLALSRVVPSPSGVVYVFAVCGRKWTADERGYELRGYCSILLEDYPEAPAVVGIMTEKPDGDWRMSFAMVFMENPITDEIRGYAAHAREVGILGRQVRHEGQLHEYPEE